jgi:hypothetical protein
MGSPRFDDATFFVAWPVLRQLMYFLSAAGAPSLIAKLLA